MRKALLYSLTLGLLSIAMPALAGMASLRPGAHAPQFTLQGDQGKPVSLADFKGKLVVLEWFNEGCPFVVKHYESGNMQGLQKKYTDLGVVWLSIASSAKGKQGYLADADEAAKSKKEHKAHMSALLLDPKGEVGKAYGAKTTPNMVVIGKDGKVAYLGAIDDKPSTDPEDIPGARNHVAAALDELLAGKPVSLKKTKSYGCSVKY